MVSGFRPVENPEESQEVHLREKPAHLAGGVSDPPTQSMIQTMPIPRHMDDGAGVTGFANAGAPLRGMLGVSINKQHDA